jgi:hypothetical protein
VGVANGSVAVAVAVVVAIAVVAVVVAMALLSVCFSFERSRLKAGKHTWGLQIPSAPVFCILMRIAPVTDTHLFYGQP